MPETCTPALSRSIMFRYSENCSVIEPKQAIINQNGTPLPRNSITSLTEHFGEMTNTTSTGSYTSAIRMTLWPGLVRNVLLRRVIRHRQPIQPHLDRCPAPGPLRAASVPTGRWPNSEACAYISPYRISHPSYILTTYLVCLT